MEIENIAIIDNALIDFEQGYHVLTGETGAGKSIILDALALVAGARAQKELIRKGEDMATVKAVIAVTNENRDTIEQHLGKIEDDYITTERILYKDGKSVAKINGKIEPLKSIKEIVTKSVEICGQKSHADLFREEYYRELVDKAGDAVFQETYENYKTTYKEWKQAKKELEEWQENDREQEQMLDLYRFQMQEIEEANLVVGEDEEIEIERKKLSSFEKLNQTCQKAMQVFQQLDDWYLVEEAVRMMQDIDGGYEDLTEQVGDVTAGIDDIRHEISRYANELEYDEGRLNEIIYRQEDIKKIKRKYGNTVEEVLEYYDSISEKMNQYDKKDELIAALEKKVRTLTDSLKEKAKALHEKRIVIAKKMSEKIQKELQELAMPHAEFSLLPTLTDEFYAWGMDEVHAYFNANKGEEMRPIQKIASGGEMARVLLTIKVVTSENTPGKTLIFDEVDEGIGGDVGVVIGKKMKQIGLHTQVIVISHLPQVASKATHHYQIQKQVVSNRTFSTIQRLNEEERIEEVARMLYGNEADEGTREQAKRMIEE